MDIHLGAKGERDKLQNSLVRIQIEILVYQIKYLAHFNKNEY